jgi:hypothetical protein
MGVLKPVHEIEFEGMYPFGPDDSRWLAREKILYLKSAWKTTSRAGTRRIWVSSRQYSYVDSTDTAS